MTAGNVISLITAIIVVFIYRLAKDLWALEKEVSNLKASNDKLRAAILKHEPLKSQLGMSGEDADEENEYPHPQEDEEDEPEYPEDKLLEDVYRAYVVGVIEGMKPELVERIRSRLTPMQIRRAEQEDF